MILKFGISCVSIYNDNISVPCRHVIWFLVVVSMFWMVSKIQLLPSDYWPGPLWNIYSLKPNTWNNPRPSVFKASYEPHFHVYLSSGVICFPELKQFHWFRHVKFWHRLEYPVPIWVVVKFWGLRPFHASVATQTDQWQIVKLYWSSGTEIGHLAQDTF